MELVRSYPLRRLSIGSQFPSVALAIAHVQGIVLLATGCVTASLASLLFSVIRPSATYFAYGFPAAVAVVFGSDFIFATGSLYVAKVARPEEQSVVGGLFNTLMQVCKLYSYGKGDGNVLVDDRMYVPDWGVSRAGHLVDRTQSTNSVTSPISWSPSITIFCFSLRYTEACAPGWVPCCAVAQLCVSDGWANTHSYILEVDWGDCEDGDD